MTPEVPITSAQLGVLQRTATSAAWKGAKTNWARFMCVPFEDLRQAALEGAWVHHQRFDAAVSPNYRAWIWYGAFGAVRHYLRDEVSPIRIPRRLYEAHLPSAAPYILSTDAAIPHGNGDGDSFDWRFLRKEEPGFSRTELIDLFRRVLTAKECMVMLYTVLYALPQLETGSRMHLSQKHVSRLFRRACQKLRTVMVN